MGPSTLATLFNHMWPRFVAEHTRATCGGDMYVMYANALSVAETSHTLQCARQSLKIMVSYGNKYPRHNARPHVVEQSGQCARALFPQHLFHATSFCTRLFFFFSPAGGLHTAPCLWSAFAHDTTRQWTFVVWRGSNVCCCCRGIFFKVLYRKPAHPYSYY